MANELNVVRHGLFEPIKEWGPIYYANGIAHEILTFGVLGHASDWNNTTALTGMKGKTNEYINFTDEERAAIVLMTTPSGSTP